METKCLSNLTPTKLSAQNPGVLKGALNPNFLNLTINIEKF